MQSNPLVVSAVHAAGCETSGGSSKSPPTPRAVVPLPDRVALLTLPELAMKNKGRIRPEEVWDALAEHFSPLEQKFVQIQYIRQDRFRVWCTSAEVLEDVISTGVALRGHPVVIRPYQARSWVTITHLPFGLVEADIAQALAPYGKVHEVKFVSFRKIRTGTVKVRMDISTTIPTRLRVCGHAGLVFHQGQTRTCFNCGVLGHESRKCPQKAKSCSVPKTPEETPAPPTTPKAKRKRKRRRRAPLPNTEGGPSGSAGSGEDRPPTKRAGAPPLPATTVPGGAPTPPPLPALVESSKTSGATTGPGMEVEQPPAPSVSQATTEQKTAPYSHLFSVESLDAVSRAPADVTETLYPRHSGCPEFRQVADGGYVYMEEGEIAFPEHPYPALRAALEARGEEVRAKLVDLRQLLESIPQHELFITNEKIVIFDGDDVKAEVEIQLRRSTIVASFLESQPAEFLQLMHG